MEKSKIEIKNLTKIYNQYDSVLGRVLEQFNMFPESIRKKEICVLRNLNLNIKDGERIGIIGRNGAGKSTLLRIISGLLKPTSGAYKINGMVTALFDTSTGFHPDFTGRQNVLANLGYRGIIGKEAQKILDEVIEFSELYDFIDSPFKTYSAGMQSRLTFSVATCIKPDILIIDEVLGAGDAYFTSKCLERMKQITMNGATVILVSHSMSAIMQFCNRAIWIDRGNILADGRPINVVEEYQKSVDTYERLRIIAKNNRFNIKLSPSILSGTLGKYLTFKLYSEEEDTKIYLHQIKLMNKGQIEQIVTVGGPMDMDVAYGIFIVDDDKRNAWSGPLEVDNKVSRCLNNNATGASFLALIPLVTSLDDNYEIQLVVKAQKDCKIALNVNDSNGASRLIFNDKISEGDWQHLAVAIPQSVYNVSTFEENMQDSSATTEPKELEQNNYSNEYPIKNEALIEESPISDNTTISFPDDIGPIYITKFEIQKDGINETIFNTGDSFEGIISYYSKEAVEAPIFVINITRVDGIRMRQSIAPMDGFNINRIKPGSGKVRIKMDPLIFGPGDYLISIGIFKNIDLTNTMTMSKPMSLRSNAYEFKVQRLEDVLVDMGCVQCKVDWEELD